MDRSPRFDESDFAAAPPDEERSSPAGPDALAELSRHLEELAAYARHLLTAKADSVKSQVRRLVVTLALAVVGLAVALGGLIAAAVLALTGIAGGLGAATGHVWLGQTIVGLGVLVLAAAAALLAQKRIRRSWFSTTTQKYEELKRGQRREFGHDVDDVARAA